jgi:hypothetical protein
MKPAKPAAPLPPVPPRRGRRMQFTIFGLMVLTFVASIGFSQLYYWARVAQGDSTAAPVAVLMAVALPMLVMTVISVGYSLNRWFIRRRR